MEEDDGYLQLIKAVYDMSRNYFDMREDNVSGNDDYFHCKANFEAAQRGTWDEKTAKYLGDTKEGFDYLKNRFRGISPQNAYTDYLSDKYVNYLGRHQNRTGLYSNSRDACAFFRKDKTDERY